MISLNLASGTRPPSICFRTIRRSSRYMPETSETREREKDLFLSRTVERQSVSSGLLRPAISGEDPPSYVAKGGFLPLQPFLELLVGDVRLNVIMQKSAVSLT